MNIKKVLLLSSIAILSAGTTHPSSDNAILNFIAPEKYGCVTVDQCKQIIKHRVRNNWHYPPNLWLIKPHHTEIKARIIFDDSYNISEVWILKKSRNPSLDRSIREAIFNSNFVDEMSVLPKEDFHKIKEVDLMFRYTSGTVLIL